MDSLTFILLRTAAAIGGITLLSIIHALIAAQ